MRDRLALCSLLALGAVIASSTGCVDDEPGSSVTASSTTTSSATTGAGGAGGEGEGGAGGRGGAGGSGGDAAPGAYLVGFESASDDLVANDTNGDCDVFVYSSHSASLTLLSHAEGTDDSATGCSQDLSFSRNGRYAVFASDATDIETTLPDTNGAEDIFLVDLQTGARTLVSVNAAGTATGNSWCGGAAVSDDGRYVVFTSDATDLQTEALDDNASPDLFVRDMQLGVTTLVSVDVTGTKAAESASDSYGRFVTPDGRYVVFYSDATDLTSALDTNGASDVFVRDLVAGTTTLVSWNAAGTAAADGASYVGGQVASDDGRHIAFVSTADDLQSDVADENGDYDVFVRDTLEGTSTLVTVDESGTFAAGCFEDSASIDAEARHVGFVSLSTELQSAVVDANDAPDAFVRDLVAGTTVLVSVDSTGTSAADGPSGPPIPTPDGLGVAFVSNATNLVEGVADGNAGQIDVYIRDLSAGTTSVVSLLMAGGKTGQSWSYLESVAQP
jgi:Tol biopolymer transport system component